MATGVKKRKLKGRQGWRSTYSLTLWLCNGCKKGLLAEAVGVAPSEEEGKKGMLERGFVGLNKPGDETGVLSAVER